MKKIFFLKRNAVATAVSLAGLTIFAGCNKSAEETPKAITVANGNSLTQEVFADETDGKSNVTFATTGAWTSSIAESAPLTKAPETPAWISIDPASGDKAGDYTVAISLAPNYSGASRSAIITVSCNGTDITISVTQKDVKKDGTKPAPMTQAEIVALLTESWDKSMSAPEWKVEVIEAINDGVENTSLIERNVSQKRMLIIHRENGEVEQFTYEEDTVRYGYYVSADISYKWRNILPANYWNSKFGDDTRFDIYTWTVSGSTFTGVRESRNGSDRETVTVELAADGKVKTTKNIETAEDGTEVRTVTDTFSYGNVNPAFPAGFDRADFPLQGSEPQYGGDGAFIYRLDYDSINFGQKTLFIDGAKINAGNNRIIFYKDNRNLSDIFNLEMRFPSEFTELPGGTYSWTDNFTGTQEYQCYGYIDGHNYSASGGTVTVARDGNTYTLTVNINVEYLTSEGSILRSGVIEGSYTGYLTVE